MPADRPDLGLVFPQPFDASLGDTATLLPSGPGSLPGVVSRGPLRSDTPHHNYPHGSNRHLPNTGCTSLGPTSHTQDAGTAELEPKSSRGDDSPLQISTETSDLLCPRLSFS